MSNLVSNIYSFAKVRSIAALGIVCMMLFVAASCNKEEPDIPFDVPIDVSFTVFSSPYCGGERSSEINEVIIINSERELRDYVSCMRDRENYFPVIDFSKHSVMIVSGRITGGGVFRTNVDKFQQISTNTFRLELELIPSDKTYGGWSIILITSRLNNRNNIEINTTINRNYWNESENEI